jgi:prefoldin subunit 5
VVHPTLKEINSELKQARAAYAEAHQRSQAIAAILQQAQQREQAAYRAVEDINKKLLNFCLAKPKAAAGK